MSGWQSLREPEEVEKDSNAAADRPSVQLDEAKMQVWKAIL